MTVDNEGRRIAKTANYSGLRKIIGTRMKASLEKAPQAMISTSMDMSGLAAVKAKLADAGHKVTYTDLLVRVIGIALQKCPEVNVAVVDGKIHQYESVNIGVAVGTAQGLYVPVIKEVQEKSLFDISAELKAIVAGLKSGNVDPTWFAGGTFTISNLGMYDIETCTPILNTPEAGILCVGSTKKKAVVTEDDQIVIRPMATFSMTLDHSAMDGVPGAVFLKTIGEILAAPEAYLDENGNYKGGI